MEQHEANQAAWDASTDWWKEKEDFRGIWTKAHQEPSLVFSPIEMSFLEGVKGKDVCVLGSGDNEVAFALTGLGGNVISVDISQRRLDVAAERSRILGLKLSFVRADVINLATFNDKSFDLVYTGGHMSVWVSNIRKYYSEAVRILRPNGLFIINEYHPVRRMWADSEGLNSLHRYFNRGPYKYTSDKGLPTYEFHWTVADHIQAVIDAGCRIIKVDEYGENVEDEFWMQADLNKLPANMVIIGRKEPPVLPMEDFPNNNIKRNV